MQIDEKNISKTMYNSLVYLKNEYNQIKIKKKECNKNAIQYNN